MEQKTCGAETPGALVVADVVPVEPDGDSFGPDGEVAHWSVAGAEGIGVVAGAEEGVGATPEVDVGLSPDVCDEVLKGPAPGARPERSAHPETRPTATVKAAMSTAGCRRNMEMVARRTKRPPIWLRSTTERLLYKASV